MSRNFSSFNTPENIQREKEMRGLLGCGIRAEYPSPLPKHYRDVDLPCRHLRPDGRSAILEHEGRKMCQRCLLPIKEKS